MIYLDTGFIKNMITACVYMYIMNETWMSIYCESDTDGEIYFLYLKSDHTLCWTFMKDSIKDVRLPTAMCT